jgi:regulator of protease activity HflC (stomatin/prohibitin superfamily)
MNENFNLAIIGVIVFVLVLGLLPIYNVWRSKLSGEAELVKAEQTRQISVAQAQAELDSAIKRAEAISIMGEAAKKYPEYRYQEFVGAFGEALKEGKINQIIYVPTEGNIPLLESRTK